MTRVCLVGDEDVRLRAELLSYETARRALDTYDLLVPWANTVAIETISLGAAVSLCNDLNWYLVRLTDDAFVLEPSISEDEWLSRPLATEIRNEVTDPADTGDLLKIYGVVEPEEEEEEGGLSSLTEPMYAQRVGEEIPEYDLRPVEDTVAIRVTGDEFGG